MDSEKFIEKIECFLVLLEYISISIFSDSIPRKSSFGAKKHSSSYQLAGTEMI